MVDGSRTWISSRDPGPKPFDPAVLLQTREAQACRLVERFRFDLDAVRDAGRTLEAHGAEAERHQESVALSPCVRLRLTDDRADRQAGRRALAC